MSERKKRLQLRLYNSTFPMNLFAINRGMFDDKGNRLPIDIAGDNVVIIDEAHLMKPLA